MEAIQKMRWREREREQLVSLLCIATRVTVFRNNRYLYPYTELSLTLPLDSSTSYGDLRRS